jgi:tRNA threonylcarbamoyladenosine biosynthesis protein TsaE
MKYLTQTEKQTFNLGRALAKKTKTGQVFALTGHLGAGKTVLVKGFAAGLDIKKIITSPTFVLMKVYPVNKKGLKIKKLVHIDCYRINQVQAIIDIGALEYFGQPETVVLIEWAERIKKILPKDKKVIKIEIGKNNKRIISLK